MNKKKRTLLKSAVLGFTAIATSLTIGMSAACSTGGNDSSSSTDDEDKTTTKIDSQTVKNGNFEFYSDNDGLYPISNPDSWSKGSSGNTSNSMSGVINTSKERWDYITDPDFAQILEDNDDLESGDDDKKDYNGALADDLPYKNTHTATDDTNKDEHAKDFIENPFTHNYRHAEDGTVLDRKGNEVETYKGDDDKWYYKDAEDNEQPFETSVLMIHNYRRSDYYGAETYYTSSTTVTLEANTAAAISVWVKTTEMYFGNSSSDREDTRIEFDRGAYIKVNTQVGGNSIDAFEIKNINTEKLNPVVTKTVDEKEVIDYENWENNGWVQYTVYVAATSFATTSVNIVLGLGQNEANTVEGYAFFDDVDIIKYDNVDAMKAACADSGENWDEIIHGTKTGEKPFVNVSYPLIPDAKTEFRVDKESYYTEDTQGDEIVTTRDYENNFYDRHFFVDLASYKDHSPVSLTDSVTAGLTIEETNTGKYYCTEYTADNKYKTNLNQYKTDKGPEEHSYEDLGLYIPTALKTNGINIGNDVLATTPVGGENWKFTAVDTEYSAVLTDALKTATDLPGAGENTSALVMLSAYGAAYEAHIRDDSFKLTDDQYMLVSFWIKTSDMKGSTAATVTVRGLDGDDKDITSSFTVDSTTLSTVTIGKNEDAYNGWARCFIRVSNTSKDDAERPFEIVVNFGNTSIRSTSKSSYKYGWLALTNLTVMEELDEDVYGYTSGSSQTATIAFTEPAEKTSHLFDTEQGEKNEIKSDLATPSSYTGVNGASKTVLLDKIPESVKDIDGYNDTNKNGYAGLLSKEYFEKYAERYEESDHNDCMWYNALQTIEADNLAAHDNNLWNAVFGERTVQPLLIVNTMRSIGQSAEQKRYNYGYIGKSATVSANGYKAVSVKVKASEGAVANVYLVEDKSGGEVLTYATPEYNFWYDADGNILKHEPEEDQTKEQQKENIAYTLRKDGLYEKDGVLYANFYNLTRHYDQSFENENFYDEDGNRVIYSSKNISDDKIYYADANKTAYAPHYLIAGGKINNKVYLYSGEGTGDDATYYYVEDGKANKSKLVHGIDKSIARYVNDNAPDTPYYFTIDTVANPDYAGKWITVTFYIHAGAEAKSYRLELWSGAREVESSYTEGNYARDSYVIFDYSDLSSSLNQSTFDGLVQQYTDDIIAEYKKNITGEFADNDSNISDLEEKAGENNRVNLYDYKAAYYTFSLYDSAAFIPFNGEINTDDTGYDFDYTESAESLAFLKVVDNGLPYGADPTNNPDTVYTMSSFIDYSVIDKDVDIIGEPTAPGTGDSDSGSSGNSGDSSNVWLLASSIILVVAIFVAIAAIFIRDFVKNRKGKKSSGKNTYNFNKNKRYVKKYVKANGEAPAIEEGEFDESLMSDSGATAAETEAETEETVEETPAEESTPAENVEEKPEDDNKEE